MNCCLQIICVVSKMCALLILCVTTGYPSAACVSLLGQANSDTVSNRSVLNGGVRARMRLHGSENTAPSVAAASTHRSSAHLSLPASTGSGFLQESCRSPLNLPYPIQPERTVDICSVGRVDKLSSAHASHLHWKCYLCSASSDQLTHFACLGLCFWRRVNILIIIWVCAKPISLLQHFCIVCV